MIAKILLLIANLLAIAAFMALLVAPMYSEEEVVVTAEGVMEVKSTSATIVEENGWWVVGLLVGPVVVVAVGSAVGWWRRSRGALWVTVGVMLAFCAVSLAPVGMFYAPSALVMVAAAVMVGRRRPDASLRADPSTGSGRSALRSKDRR